MRALAIGWDVGGWLGKKQAVAVIAVETGGTWHHLGASAPFSLRGRTEFSVLDLVRTAWPEAPEDALGGRDVVVAIDAPLSFPRAFVDLLAGAAGERPTSDEEIANGLAYRDCDRFIHGEHQKKPLSASFDKLGNNATVAMVLSRQWGAGVEPFVVLPSERLTHPRRELIEAYPALMKTRGVVVDHVRALLPSESRDVGDHLTQDQQDAAICALVALAHLGIADRQLPSLVGPVAGQSADGWIYAPSRAWVEGR